MVPGQVRGRLSRSLFRRAALFGGALVLAVYGVVVPVAGAVASGPSLTSSGGGRTLPPGTALTITGAGFVAGAPYELEVPADPTEGIPGTRIAVMADSNGSFTASYDVPLTVHCGAQYYYLDAFQPGSSPPQLVAEVGIFIQYCSLGGSEVNGNTERNTPFTLDGYGFAAGETVGLTSPNGRLTITRVTANAQGTFSISERVEEPIRPQQVTITATGAMSGRTPSLSLIVSNSTLWAGYKLLSQNSEVDSLVAPTRDTMVLYFGGGAVWMEYGTCGYSVAGPGQSGFDPAALAMQTDGNLVLYDTRTGRALWSTRTAGTGAHNRLVLQDGGNAVLYSPTGRVLWQSATIVNTVLKAGQAMGPGQYLFDCGYRLSLATVGGLWLTGVNPQQPYRLWSVPAPGAAERLVLQTDGNLVLYSSKNKALWNTHTAGTGSHNRLVLQPHGNLALDNAQNKVLWSSNTGG